MTNDSSLFPPFSRWMEEAVLENPLRRLIQSPLRVLKEMGVKLGDVLMDVGCGFGYLSIPAAELVAPTGLVYSVDVDEFKLRKLRERARSRNLSNLRTIRSEAWKIEEVDSCTVDVAVMFFSLHHFEKLRESMEEAKTKLRRGGRLFVYDPIRTRFAGHGTSAEEVMKMGIDLGFSLRSLKKRGLTYSIELMKS
ncbi:MAG: class I SAM-dependent methyltransferase [Thaumarchaeota archaeon]|nr:class I SAM-dependent methyltransferase [Candidatus Calditenuaceae archaeon]MDW8187340.1 methyltransferase domain-containing protein [Nitrososphaerota archaeon]